MQHLTPSWELEPAQISPNHQIADEILDQKACHIFWTSTWTDWNFHINNGYRFLIIAGDHKVALTGTGVLTFWSFEHLEFLQIVFFSSLSWNRRQCELSFWIILPKWIHSNNQL